MKIASSPRTAEKIEEALVTSGGDTAKYYNSSLRKKKQQQQRSSTAPDKSTDSVETHVETQWQ